VERTVRLTEIVVVGSVNLDLVVTAPTLPQPGETVLGGDLRTVPGGKGANQFIGAVGQDAFAQPLRDNLAAAGVALRGLRTVPGPSGVALITVDAAAENSIVVAPGANAQLSGLDAEDRAAIAAADVLLCQLEIPLTTVRQAAIAARAAGTMVVLNAAPARALPAELLDAVDILVVNEVEAAAVAAAGWSTDVLTALLAVVPRVVLTLGARGAAYADRDGTRLDVDAPRIDAVDTTAAGDAFAGAFVVALAERRPVAEALRWACAAGAACARRPGASSALPTRDDIDDLFATTYRATP
jgi:ribokinase